MIPFPDKKYNVIYGDPPWGYQTTPPRAAADTHSGPRTSAELNPSPSTRGGGCLAADDCALFMWATFPMLREALDLIEAWGFKYKTIAFNWIKQNKSGAGLFWGLGNWTRSNSEICLLAIRGKPKRISAAVHSVVMAPVQKHSQKPDEVRERIVKLVGDVPRIELFARAAAPGWDCWGNEAPQNNTEIIKQEELP